MKPTNPFESLKRHLKVLVVEIEMDFLRSIDRLENP